MSTNSQPEINEYGILSAVWILASNDENPMMLYGSIRFRLGLPDSSDIETLIKKHGELFRQRCPQIRLDTWKQSMQVEQRRPLWIQEMDKDSQETVIQSLTVDDVFRSQFRVVPNAPKSDVNIIDWGLEHIDRLRKADSDKREARWKWLKEGVIPVLSLIIALITIVITAYFQYDNIHTQKLLKEYELSFSPKQEGYTSFMKALNTAFDIAIKNSTVPPPARNDDALLGQFRQIENAYYGIEPFLKTDSRTAMWEKYQEFQHAVFEINNRQTNNLDKEEIGKRLDKIIEIKDFFRNELKKELFIQSISN
jgi:hypothetical protein